MNYLAHLHIADYCQSSLLGNLLGDFVKGDPQGKYQPSIVQGVRLHRFVDGFTDNHPLVKQAKGLFPQGPRRFSGIALDMFWDHCLARDWDAFHHLSLELFCTHAERQVNATQTNLPERFERINGLMWEGRWLESYQSLDNIGYALERMSRRSPRMGQLTECTPFLGQNYQQLSQLFARLYPDVLTASKRF